MLETSGLRTNEVKYLRDNSFLIDYLVPSGATRLSFSRADLSSTGREQKDDERVS